MHHYTKFRLLLADCIREMLLGNCSATHDLIRSYFDNRVNRSAAFEQYLTSSTRGQEPPSRMNTDYSVSGINLQVGTIHSVKGQTHTTTLYLETYFNSDGKGADAVSYESQRMSEQISGEC